MGLLDLSSDMSKKILIISPVPSHPQSAGNRSRIYTLLSLFKKMGHEIHFCYIAEAPADEEAMRKEWGSYFHRIPYTGAAPNRFYDRLIRKLRCTLTNYPAFPNAIDDWYDDLISDFLRDLQQQLKFEVVIVVYAFFSKALTCFGRNVLKIIDAQDRFANRAELCHDHGVKYSWYSTTIKEEIKGLRRADYIMAIQSEEADYFRKYLGNRVITVGHLVQLQKSEKHNLTKTILFVASKNEANIKSIQYFLDEIFPHVQAKVPEVKLLLAGNICDVIEEKDGCIKLGFIADLDKLYSQSEIVINPCLFGTGLKIKSIEALGRSKALITTEEGAKGLQQGSNWAFLVAKDHIEFSQHVINALTNSALVQNLSQQAFVFAENYNQVALKPLIELLKMQP